MNFKPDDYDISVSYQHWPGDKAENHIGPFFFRMDGENCLTAFRVNSQNCNASDIVHGGVLMTFADYTLCIAANKGTSESVVTVSCNNEFIAPALAGDLVEGRGEVIKRGGSIIFARSELRVRDTVILTSSAVIKRIRPR